MKNMLENKTQRKLLLNTVFTTCFLNNNNIKFEVRGEFY
jgi:hypothetical protein